MKVKIREFLPADINEVQKIATKAFDDYVYEDYLKMGQDSNYKFLVATRNEEVVGFLIFLQVDIKLEIIKIATSSSALRLGVATALIDYMFNYGKSAGFSGVILEVNEKNAPAINLYEKLGFKKIHVRKKYYNYTFDAIIMEFVF